VRDETDQQRRPWEKERNEQRPKKEIVLKHRSGRRNFPSREKKTDKRERGQKDFLTTERGDREKRWCLGSGRGIETLLGCPVIIEKFQSGRGYV